MVSEDFRKGGIVSLKGGNVPQNGGNENVSRKYLMEWWECFTKIFNFIYYFF